MHPMGTDKPRISTVARLAERVAHLELALAEAAVPERDPIVRLALALEVAQVRAVRVAEPARCRRTAAVAQIASVVALSHQAQGSVRVATLLVGVGLTEAPLDRPVLAEVPAWAVVDSAMAAEEE